MRTIYFDYNATTPLDPEVREEMLPYLGGEYGNPSSIHHVGRRARALLDAARERVAAVWQCKPSEVVFTSGGTEANNLAILGTARLLRDRGRHLITSSAEHHAVLHCFDYLRRREGFEVTLLPVDHEARVQMEDLRQAIRPDTVLVSLMAANNEVGTVQAVAQMGAHCRERGIVFHTDAIQWFGKMPFSSIHQFNADLVSCCSHKLHGPRGAGALFLRSPLQPDPLLFGGPHENERRAGTENLAAVAGFASATDRFVRNPVFHPPLLSPMIERLRSAIALISDCCIVSPPASALPNTLAFTFHPSDSLTLLANLDLSLICASSGAACSAGSLTPSHVLSAMGLPSSHASSLVRFSLGRYNTQEEVEFLVSLLPSLLHRSRSFS